MREGLRAVSHTVWMKSWQMAAEVTLACHERGVSKQETISNVFTLIRWWVVSDGGKYLQMLIAR